MAKFAACLGVVACAVVLSTTTAKASDAEAAIEAAFPPEEWAVAKAVAYCESTYNPEAYNPASAAYGIFQFLPSTAYGNGFDYAAMADPYYAARSAYILKERYGWSQWECIHLI